MNSNIYRERIELVRELMRDKGIAVYLVCTNDYHMSEYTGEYFNEREFLSGFDGSAGDLVIGLEKAYLFTDGRYYIQAENQLLGSGIELMRMGSEGVCTIEECIYDMLKNGEVLGLDGRMTATSLGLKLKNKLSNKGAGLDVEFNATMSLWKDRPEFPSSNAYVVEVGESTKDKLTRLREQISDVDGHIIATLDDICWLYNIRGNDVECNPVVMAYSYVTDSEAILYIDEAKLSGEVSEYLAANGVTVRGYEDIYSDIVKLKGKRVLADFARINYSLYQLLLDSCDEVVDRINPCVTMKAIKNETELNNLRSVHIEDGLCVTRLAFWVKSMVKQGVRITEGDAARFVDGLRAKISDYKELSFPTISAYGANAAMMHYHCGETGECIGDKGFLLVDSGGQYLRGTTDITRTISLGELKPGMIRDYTLTLKGMLSLSHAHFLYGCSGLNLDILARGPLWQQGIDYRCGTGHGIGYLLNVHEAPNGFRWKCTNSSSLTRIEPGMVSSNEPGVYVEGEYGIRIENELVAVKDYENEYGIWMRFETLTCAVLDMDAVDATLLTETEKCWLNEYNMWVRTTLGPHMTEAERVLLEEATRLI